MGLVQRQSIPSTIVTYLGVVLGFFNFMWLLPRHATTEEVGLIRILISVATLFFQLASLGMIQTVFRFFPFFRDRDKKHHGFLTFLLAVSALGFILFSGLTLLFSDPIKSYFQQKSPLFNQYFFYILPTGGLILFAEILTNYSRALFKPIVPTFIREVVIRVCNLVAILLFVYGYITFKWLVILILGAYCVQLLCLIMYLLWRNQFFLFTKITFLTKSMVREIFSYTSFMFVAGISGVIILNVDTIMLGAQAGLSDTGIYSVMLLITNLVTIPSRTMMGIVLPIVGEAWSTNDKEKIALIYKQTAINNLLIGGIFFILIWINLDFVLAFLPPAYAAGKWVFFISGLTRLFDVATGVNGEIIVTSRHYRFIIYSNLFVIIIAIVSNYLLIRDYGIIGASIAMAISIMSFNFARIVFLQLKYSLLPFTGKYAAGLLILGITYILGEVITIPHHMFWSALLKTTIVSAFFAITMFWFRPSEEIDALVQGTLQKGRDFLRRR